MICRLAILILAIGCCEASAKCPQEMNDKVRARLEAAAATVVNEPLDPKTLRFCVMDRVGLAHIATVTHAEGDGTERWIGLNCYSDKSGHGIWSCGAESYRGFRVTPAAGVKEERVTIGNDT